MCHPGGDALVADCTDDVNWSFLYTAALLKFMNGTGASLNPVVIR